MNFKPNKAVWTSVGVGVVIAAGAIANTVTIPNTFTAHTPALSAQVNANFLAVKTAVDDNANRIAALEAHTCPSGWTQFGAYCYESTARAATFFRQAAITCASNDAFLPPPDIAHAAMIAAGASRVDAPSEFTNNVSIDIDGVEHAVLVVKNSSNALMWDSATSSGDAHAYRCFKLR